jgi:hypothetical protein
MPCSFINVGMLKAWYRSIDSSRAFESQQMEDDNEDVPERVELSIVHKLGSLQTKRDDHSNELAVTTCYELSSTWRHDGYYKRFFNTMKMSSPSCGSDAPGEGFVVSRRGNGGNDSCVFRPPFRICSVSIVMS